MFFILLAFSVLALLHSTALVLTITNGVTSFLMEYSYPRTTMYMMDCALWRQKLELCQHFFIILKNSHQDLYNEGSNFILSSLEVGH